MALSPVVRPVGEDTEPENLPPAAPTTPHAQHHRGHEDPSPQKSEKRVRNNPSVHAGGAQ